MFRCEALPRISLKMKLTRFDDKAVIRLNIVDEAQASRSNENAKGNMIFAVDQR